MCIAILSCNCWISLLALIIFCWFFISSVLKMMRYVVYVNRHSFAFSFHMWMPFISFLIALGKTFSTTLNNSGESQLALLLISGINFSVFSFEHDVCCKFLWCFLSHWTDFLLFLLSWVFISWNSTGFCLNFFCINCYHHVFYFKWLLWCITLLGYGLLFTVMVYSLWLWLMVMFMI